MGHKLRFDHPVAGHLWWWCLVLKGRNTPWFKGTLLMMCPEMYSFPTSEIQLSCHSQHQGKPHVHTIHWHNGECTITSCVLWFYTCIHVLKNCISTSVATVLHLKSHQRCSAGIRTWLSADRSSSSTLTESSFLFDPCRIHRGTVMLE